MTNWIFGYFSTFLTLIGKSVQEMVYGKEKVEEAKCDGITNIFYYENTTTTTYTEPVFL